MIIYTPEVSNKKFPKFSGQKTTGWKVAQLRKVIITGERICPCCGKIFIIQYPSAWVWKVERNRNKKHELLYFCSRGCKNKYMEEHPTRKKGQKE